jgi:hypothetical protein
MAEVTKQINWAEQALDLVLKGSAVVIFNNYLKLWRLLKYRLLKFKDWRIIYGTTDTGRQIFDFPKGRNRHTYIKGLTGFGKSGLAVNLAIQNIEHGTSGIFLDPHGNPYALPDERGAILEIFERVRSVANILFLTVNQRKKVIGDNPLVLFGRFKTLDALKDYLLNAIFFDAKASLATGYQVPNMAGFILESAIYFHNAYLEWLVIVRGKNATQARIIILSHQLTFNDLAHLEDNPKLIDLFIEILGFRQSKYYRPDLVAQWQAIKDATKFEVGFKGVTGRFKKIVSTSKSKLFFESCGFDVLKERRKGKFVLCDLSGLDEFSLAIISKLILVRVFIYQIKGIFKGQTEFYIDEAPNIEISNLPRIAAQGRKKKLALTLIFQYTTQFSDPKIIDAIHKGIVTKINFQNNEPDFHTPLEKITNLKDREFLFSNTWRKGLKLKTVDMHPIQRTVQFEERGIVEAELRVRILAKRTNIEAFFKNI